MIANYLSFFKLVGLIYKVEYGSSCLILPENRTMKYILLAKTWSNAELKKLTKIVAYDDYTSGAEDGGGTENTPGGGNTSQGAGGETNKDNGGTSQGGGGTSQGTGGGTDSGTDAGGDNVSL